MRVQVNGLQQDLAPGATVAAFLSQRNIAPERVAVERNGVVVDRERFGDILLEEGDILEVIHFVGGGERNGYG